MVEIKKLRKNGRSDGLAMRISNRSLLKKYGYLWITLILFSGAIVGHWYYGFATGNTWQENMRYTFENWQSEFCS
jgi:hypothetical protein